MLQGAHVHRDGPAVRRRNLRAVGGHQPHAVAHDVENLADRHREQPFVVVRHRRKHAALDDDALAGARGVVAGSAIDTETLLSAAHEFLGQRDLVREFHRPFAGDLAAPEMIVLAQLAARHRSVDLRTHRTSVLEKRIRLLHVVPGDVVHIRVQMDGRLVRNVSPASHAGKRRRY
ncbi:MAG: hypothetical protein M5R36_28785 [Deltaproteobacteria bacterium]|nr:hypothetical protein [Deltaproteobacteria bacterium]